MDNHRIIALTGGVGSGKSRILELLKKEFGAGIIQTDHVAKQLEEPGQAGFEGLVKAFGEEIVGGDGRLKKDVLARLVFEDEEARNTVNGLIHPLVWEQVQALALAAVKTHWLVVAESALVLENPDDFFHEIWYVYTAKNERIQRLIKSRGYSEKRCLKMMDGQPSEEEYRRCADFVIDNSGSMEDVTGQIRGKLGITPAEWGSVVRDN